MVPSYSRKKCAKAEQELVLLKEPGAVGFPPQDGPLTHLVLCTP